MIIRQYHFHLYYDFSDIEKARFLANTISKNFEVPIGTVWDRPVGPHPIGSCQVTVSNDLFYEILSWILINRDGIDFFIHPVTGNDLLDHTDYAIWIGKSYPLKLSIFQ